ISSIFGWKTKTPEEFCRESMKELENQKLQAERRLQHSLESNLSDLEAQRAENQNAIEEAQKRVAEAQAAKEKATQRAERYETERREAEAQRSRDRLTREKPQVTYPLGPSGPPMIPFR
ncbi:hypothetical protein, partial [Rhodovulum sulfidophilum]|uniref:hypothetical protein n=1 Tax=Rhodovulum sulfidophilum TaxID=35806 RepID=UPI001F3B76A1